MRLAALALALAFAAPAAAQDRVTGTAYYRERIALPPGAVFDEVSCADAPAVEIARDGGVD